MNDQLEKYRAQIDTLDVEFIDVLARRFAVVREVGHLKSQTNIAVVQPERAQAVKDRAAAMGSEKGLNPEFVRRLYEVMIDYAHELEDEILEAEG